MVTLKARSHPAPNRQGALPLHLTLAIAPWLACLQALLLSKKDSSVSSILFQNAGPRARKLMEAWDALLADPLLAAAAEAEAKNRATAFLEGLYQYQNHRFVRDVEEPETVMRQGAARLLTYGGSKAMTSILLVPSLINRYYIFDLTRRLSLARYLSSRGLRIFVVDWGEPGAREQHYDCALYVTETLAPMADWVRRSSRGAVISAGYCMGGLLVLALMQIRPGLADAAAFLATPWDFAAFDFPSVALTKDDIAAVAVYIDGCETMPAETIHTLFHCANPYAFQQKLARFGRMDKSHPSTQEFLAVEHWANDGVAMARGVARDCLITWAQRNATAQGKWRVGGQTIHPERITIPCFIAAPKNDTIVPSASALPLAALLPAAHLVQPGSGHIGMMVGGRRKSSLWEPFAQWAETVV